MGYDAMGELHDLFMGPAWRRLIPVLKDAFADLVPDDVVVDLGAGTGLGTLALVGCTRAEVWALEPALVMRAALLHRVAADSDATARVSVVAGRVPEDLTALPVPTAGVVVAHVLGHLDAIQRSRVWAWVAESLTDDGVVVATFQDEPPDASELNDDEVVVEEVRIGRHRYRATHHGAGQQYNTVYDVLQDEGTVLRSTRVAGTWRPVGIERLAAEVGEHQLSCRTGSVPGVAILRRH